MTQSQNRRSKKQNNNTRVLLLAGFAVIALITTILAFVFIRNLVSTWTLGTLPGEPNLTGVDYLPLLLEKNFRRVEIRYNHLPAQPLKHGMAPAG